MDLGVRVLGIGVGVCCGLGNEKWKSLAVKKVWHGICVGL